MECSDCGDPIAECMGFTMAGDFVQACDGMRAWRDIRQRCAKCVERILRQLEGEVL